MRPLQAVLFSIVGSALAFGKDPEAARKLLDGSVEMSASVHPETGVAALMRGGITYGTFDKKAGLVLLTRASAAVPTVPNESVRDEYASGIVRAAADLDVHAATELLRQLPNPASAATTVVRRLIATKDFDRAIELLALTPQQAEYPHEAASHLIAHLPKEDPRRAIAFGRATEAFARRPGGPFPALVERFGKEMPAALKAEAITAMLQRIGAWKDSHDSFSGKAGDNESEIEIHSGPQHELRELVSVVRIFDRAAIDRIVTQRADIAAALAGFRKPRTPAEPIVTEPGKSDAEDDNPLSPPFGIGMADNFTNFRQRIADYGKATKEAEKVGEAMKKDPAEAVRLARTLPDVIRAEVLAVIASTVLAKDPALAASVVDSCVTEIGRIDNPASRIPALIKLGGIYTRLKDPGRAYAAYERALADAVPLWSRDTKADRPNVASRDVWPSVQAVRTAAHEAALNLGASAENLLSSMTVPDLILMARIHMARALLGLTPDIHNISVNWVDKDMR